MFSVSQDITYQILQADGTSFINIQLGLHGNKPNHFFQCEFSATEGRPMNNFISVLIFNIPSIDLQIL